MIKIKVWHPEVVGHYWEGEFEIVGEAVEFVNKASADIEAAQQGVQPTDGSLCKDCGHPVEIKQVAGCLNHPVIG